MRHSTRTIRSPARTVLATLAAAALAWGAGPGASPAPAQAQEAADTALVEEVSVTVGPDRAALEAELSDGTRADVALEDGDVVVAGEDRASYTPGGELESAWRDFLRTRVDPGGANLGSALRRWSPPAGADSAAAQVLTAAVAELATMAERGAPAAAGSGAAAPAPPPADTAEILGEDTDLVPSDGSLEEVQDRVDRLRRALADIGGGASAVGTASLVVHDDYEIEAGRTVSGAVALLSGDLTIAGEVQGDVLVLDGELILEPESTIGGDVVQVGGTVTDRGGRIGGDLLSVGGEAIVSRDVEESFDEPAPPEPPEVGDGDWWEERYGPDRGIGYAVWDNVTDGFRSLFSTFSFFLVLAVIGAIPLYFARSKFETAAATVRHSFGRSFLLGLAGQVLFLPAVVVLAVGVLTIPLIPVFCLAVGLAFVLGYVAVGYAVGDVITERGYDWAGRLGSGPYRTLLVGLAALLLLFVIIAFLEFFGGIAGPLLALTIFAAVVVTWIAFTAGFGAVALSYAGTRDDYASPGGPSGGTRPPSAPAGPETGPPPGPETGGPVPTETPAPESGGEGPAGGESSEAGGSARRSEPSRSEAPGGDGESAADEPADPDTGGEYPSGDAPSDREERRE